MLSKVRDLSGINNTAIWFINAKAPLKRNGKIVTKITYVQHDGTRRVLDVTPGKTLMEGARDNNVTGIVADCGGACACSTCHVYVDEDWVARLPPISEMEKDMLEFAAEPDERSSRLSCQIKISEVMEGLVVKIPPSQTGM